MAIEPANQPPPTGTLAVRILRHVERQPAGEQPPPSGTLAAKIIRAAEQDRS